MASSFLTHQVEASDNVTIPVWDLNPRPSDNMSDALPTKLTQLKHYHLKKASSRRVSIDEPDLVVPERNKMAAFLSLYIPLTSSKKSEKNK